MRTLLNQAPSTTYPMSTAQIKGWCPGVLSPMLSGDGLLVRVRPHAGRLMPGQAAGIAALADRYGNGVLDLTTRANLQLRGVSPASHRALMNGLLDLGLVDTSPEVQQPVHQGRVRCRAKAAQLQISASGQVQHAVAIPVCQRRDAHRLA